MDNNQLNFIQGINNVVSVGADLCNIPRIQQVCRRESFRNRVFTEVEKNIPVVSLAGRFALKEAVAKAIGVPSGWSWHEVEIGAVHPGMLPSEWPFRISGVLAAQAEKLGITTWRLSITHEIDNAFALAVGLSTGVAPQVYTEGKLDFLSTHSEVKWVSDLEVAKLWPRPNKDSNKYTRGVVGLACGTDMYPGAGILAALGAINAGAGMVRIVDKDFTQTAGQILLQAVPEVVFAQHNGLDGVDALVLGPGYVNSDTLQALFYAGLQHQLPMVLDAGALSLVDIDKTLPPSVVITPHAGEIASLLQRLLSAELETWDVARVLKNPVEAVRKCAQLTGATTIIKGAYTVVVSADGEVMQSGPASSWLATAGSGDVLAGILGALIAAWCRHDNTTNTDASKVSYAWLAAVAARVHAKAAVVGRSGPVPAKQLANQVSQALAEILR